MYSLKYKVTTSTCDSEGKLKLFSALQMMQDCSEMWLDSEPQVKEYFARENMAQLLASRQVEIIRVPEFKEELTVTTSVYGMKPMFGFRNTFQQSTHITPTTCPILPINKNCSPPWPTVMPNSMNR